MLWPLTLNCTNNADLYLHLSLIYRWHYKLFLVNRNKRHVSSCSQWYLVLKIMCNCHWIKRISEAKFLLSFCRLFISIHKKEFVMSSIHSNQNHLKKNHGNLFEIKLEVKVWKKKHLSFVHFNKLSSPGDV